MASEVQDALVTILSEKVMPVPELDTEVAAIPGFNLIATANDRDRGVNELSSALKRRFNVVVLPVPATVDEEVDIVTRRVDALGRALELPAETLLDHKMVHVFRSLPFGSSKREVQTIKRRTRSCICIFLAARDVSRATSRASFGKRE